MRTIALLTLFGIALSGLSACGAGKSSNAANNGAQTAASKAGAMGNAANGAMGAATGKPNCGAVQAVWVNLKTKVYHEPSDPMYGKTKHGEYLCPSQAQAQGFRPAGGAKRHKKSSSM